MKHRNEEVWFTSDTHFGHQNIIKHSRNDQWKTSQEMDEFLIEQWNSVVKKNDRVYHFGDFAWMARDAKKIRPRLNGFIRLIVGNHDDIPSLAAAGLFSRVMLWRHFGITSNEDIEIEFTGTHIPLRDDQFRHGHQFNVHGHMHDKILDDPRYVNICVEQTNYRPLHVTELMAIFNERLKLIGDSK
jgi:calcineurin-like phosphoesterase family protein